MSAEPEARRARTHWIVRAFAIVGLLGVLALIVLAAIAISESGRYQPARVAGAERAGAQKAVFTLNRPSELTGTGLLAIDVLASEGGGGSSPYSGSTEDRRNILLIDKATGASRRLFPDNGRRIAESHFLPAEADAATDRRDEDAVMGELDAAPRAYYLIELERADGSELRDVVVGTLAAPVQGVVMSGVDGVDTLWMHSPKQIGLMVREKMGLYYRIVDVPTLKVVRSVRVAID